MNEKQKEWLEAYIESGNARKATELVYTDVKGASIATKTSYLKSTLAQEIDNHAREQYKKETPLMLNVIKEIALNCEQPAVKLKAADTWLSRAGHDAAQVLEVKETQTHEQLLERLKIATQGINPELLAGVLPKELTNLLTNQLRDQDNETKH
jgi:hypothetical protein